MVCESDVIKSRLNLWPTVLQSELILTHPQFGVSGKAVCLLWVGVGCEKNQSCPRTDPCAH